MRGFPLEVFEAKSCSEFIDYSLKGNRARAKRGELSRLAKHLGCHVTYLSLILKGDRLCSQEQGLRFCHWLGLTDLQTNYFMTQLSFERAGTPELRKYFYKLKQEIKAKASRVKEQIQTETLESNSLYFSDIRLQLVHAMVQLDHINTVEHQVLYSGWPKQWINEALEKLKDLQLIVQNDKGDWISTKNFLHLDRSQPGFKQFHQTWRNYITNRFMLKPTGKVTFLKKMDSKLST